jgi:hypothetical protein
MVNTAVFAFKPSSTTFHCSLCAQPPCCTATTGCSAGRSQRLLRGGVLLARTRVQWREQYQQKHACIRLPSSQITTRRRPTLLITRGHCPRMGDRPQ